MSDDGKDSAESTADEKETKPSPAVNDDWQKRELEYIKTGKAYGLEGTALLDYVNAKLKEIQERDQRAAEREHKRAALELETTTRRAQHEAEMARIQLEMIKAKADEKPSESKAETARRTVALKLKIPSYEGKQDIATYLDLFEAVVQQNGSPKADWPVILRATAVGTALEGAVCLEDFDDYDDIRKELLLSFGKTASLAWREMLAASQTKESFRQFCYRVCRLVQRWVSLFTEKKVSDVSKEVLLASLAEQIILESVEPDMGAYLRRSIKEGSSKDLDAFCDAGTTYQTSFASSSASCGQASTSQSPSAKSGSDKGKSKPSGTSAQCLAVSCEEAERRLFALPVDQRKAYTSKNSLCWNCLKQNHRARKCYAKGKCTKCSEKHHVLLHDAVQAGGVNAYGCRMLQPTHRHVRLMTAVAEVKGQHLRAKVRIFIDLGAQASFVSAALVRAVQPLHVGTEEVRVSAFGAPPKTSSMKRYQLDLTYIDGRVQPITALEKPALGLDILPVPQKAVEVWKSRGVTLSDQVMKDVPTEVHLLLGADYAHTLLLEKRVVNGEVAWKTELGWVLSGPQAAAATKSGPGVATAIIAATTLSTADRVELLWEMEEPLPASGASKLPAFPLEKTKDGYEVGLLWKSCQRPADNERQALASAQRLLHRLAASGKRLVYDDVLLREYMELRAIEREPDPTLPGYYMPHRAVIREEAATTKVRVVFNASAATRGEKSLNDLVDPGPSLLPALTALLFRFREFPAAVQADIRKAFFMIRVREEDRRFLRFLWPDENGVMTTWRLQKLPFGVNCSPFILTAVLNHHLQAEMEHATESARYLIELLLESFYVDDCVTSLDSPTQVDQFQSVSTTCLASAGMDLRKWRGNTMESSSEAGSTVLGLKWDTSNDTLSLVLPVDNPQPGWTRRKLLQLVAALFDPLGLACPVHLTGKILLQRAWKETSDWDELLSPKLAAQVESWWGEMLKLTDLKFPRWVGAHMSDAVTVHIFADASEDAYGCCVYVSSSHVSQLLFAKSKVAPLNAPSLPRLELQAASMAMRQLSHILNSLRVPVAEVWAWSDSLTALHWIEGDPSRWKTWVRNRVVAIRETTKIHDITWRHCPGADNPADLASRGSPARAVDEQAWRCGPEWLRCRQQWPPDLSRKQSEEAACEARVVVVQASAEVPWYMGLSRWSRLMGVASRILSWRYRSRPQPSVLGGELAARAEALLLRQVQSALFPEELRCLRSGLPVPRCSKVVPYKPFLDDMGVMRVGGRLGNSLLPECTKHPVLLGAHHVTEALLRQLHADSLHQGVDSVLTKARQTYCILGDRRLMRQIKRSCVRCRRFDAKPADEETADLPRDRVVHQRPFGLCGVDYAGPLLVKQLDMSAKVWIALFVCGTTRALHLELVDSLATEDFLLAWRRFVARRKTPQRVRSDNGTVFVAAAKALKVDWVFNPPAAPWFGGFFERLVRAIKSPLRKVLGKALLRRVELSTVLCEIEQAVNSRPLTHVGGLLEDQPLTPAGLMGVDIWPTSPASRVVGEQDIDLNARQCSKRMRYIAKITNHLKQRWMNEYLTTLNQHHAGQSRPLRQGDVVLVLDDNKRRQNCRLARILRLFAGKDGKCRVALLSTGGGTSTMRPVRRLVPLEVVTQEEGDPECTEPEPAKNHDVQDASGAEPVQQRTRTRAIKPPVRLDL